jgi:PAS domain S-box-containing protein
VNKNEEALCSIIDQAIKIIDTRGISDHWMRRTYDYRAKVVEARLPWLIGAIVLFMIILAMMAVMFLRGRGEGKRLAKLVSEKTSTLTAILDATPDIIFCKDLDSITTECNKASEKYFNVPKEKIIGKPDTQALEWTPEVQKQRLAMDAKVLNEKQVVVIEEFIQSYNGESRLFETIKTPLIQDGKVTGLVGMSRDITQRKAAEDAAKRASAEAMKAYAEAENASEAKSRFIANMNHEMRTPMNVIVGLTDLMLEEEDDISDKVRGELKKINTAGTTLMGLINDVLDISKMEAGRQELNPVQYDMASFLNDIITINIVRIGEKPVVFKLDINDNLPKSLFGDDLRVKQILNNLLSNAFKYTKEGSVTLGVTAGGIADGADGTTSSSTNYWWEDVPVKIGEG